MNNTTVTSYNQTRELSDEVKNVELYLDYLQVFWSIGLVVSCVCLIMQIVLYVIWKECRKPDEKILTQMTLAGIIQTSCEYWMCNYGAMTLRLDFQLIITVHVCSEFSLVLWMFVFTKNLYDKIVIVLPTRRLTLLVISILVWTVPLPFGLLAIFTLKQPERKYSLMFFKIYACLRFIIVTLNAVYYIKIFHVAFRKGVGSQRNFSDMSRIVFMAFILAVTTCVQVFINDVLTMFFGDSSFFIVLLVINSFYALLITIIFISILKAKRKKQRKTKVHSKNVTMTEFSSNVK